MIALFSKRGRVVRRVKFKTAQGSRKFLEDLVENLARFRKHKVRSVVVAIPGLVQKNYTVRFGNRNWSDIDIFTPIKSLFDCPICFENDANLASLYEGYNLTVAEALLLDVPVLSTKCTGPCEILDGGRYGILVENSEEGLYQGIKDLLENPDKLVYYKERAKERKDFFDEEKIVAQIEELFGE